MGRKKLGELSASKTVWLASGGVGSWTPQSMAFKSKSTRYIICNCGGSLGIQIASASGHKTTGHRLHASGHGNGGCYCSYDGRVYTSTYSGSANKTVKSWDPKNNWKLVQTIHLPVNCTGLGYDPSVNCFYVGNSSGFSVFSYSEFTKKKGSKSHKTYSNKHGVCGFWQDVGGYGGVVMRCTSHQNTTSRSYIDCYAASNGKYLGSIYTRGEVESVAVDSDGHFHVLYAKNRRVVKAKQTFKGMGLGGHSSISNNTTTTKKKVPQGNKIVYQARKYKGEGYKRFCKWAGINADWCAIFVRYVFNKCGLSKIMATINYVPRDFTDQIIKKGGKIVWDSGSYGKRKGSKKDVLPGDIALYSGHVNICCKASTDGSSVLTIGGNQRGGGHWSNNKVTEYKRSDMLWIVRPNYSDKAINGLKVTGDTYTAEGEEETGQGTLEVHPDQLYSSANYRYLEQTNGIEESEADKQFNENIRKMFSDNYVSAPRDTSTNIGIILGSAQSEGKKPATKVSGEAHGETLSTSVLPVEAPFAEITIGGHTFGAGYRDDAPNYIDSLGVKRTNASMAEYTINLTHQVSPGRNPNYIDELLSANGYEKIGIRFGDAMSGIDIYDGEAILTDVNTNFDFQSCNIKYTVSAISSKFLSATNKRNHAATTDKVSNVIRNLLTDSSSSLAALYPKMMDSNYVTLNKLIPTTDDIVQISSMNNVNDITYLKELVASMKSATNAQTTYYLELRNEDFKVHEITANSYGSGAALYEIDINYPDDAQIFTFKDNTDFAWPLAYKYNEGVSNYVYSVSKEGNVVSIPSTSNGMFNTTGNLNISNNWWKQVTEFPTTATLTCRGLLSPLLLMTYIKINSYYYGNKRLTSGVYIVTGQEDSISGNGYRTTLSLTKVAGPEQHLTVDARVKT